MKLRFDQNLSINLVRMLSDLFPESEHVKTVGMMEADDAEIWSYARDNGFVIVSKDTDFQQRSLVLGAPRKVVWLRVGNCPTNCIVEALQSVFRRATYIRKRFAPDLLNPVLNISQQTRPTNVASRRG